ncbi:D-(-)-3-hydroxybutyrate oligomer hydrolase [Pseudorhodoferax aquiterrae]|uniref:D-(-)-3-hydroxybutyrate oligomer hydrolase n=2 Tax=Pseudorhodoferax aquiterrae TaxID=747304 RepID=A0ABQ3G101_9BURK|nr:D-(-)-3-hydroxybutyrate oligomer hydrolase [Pseudorhodoferax aquiterrae]
MPLCAVALAAATLLAACGGDDGPKANVKPEFVGTVTMLEYDGGQDDLLTAGLGKTGLAGAAPGYADAAAPRADELRRNAIYNNYRALLDMTAAGGYGVLYGPNVALDGSASLGEGKVAGGEYIAYSDDGTGRRNVTLMVQVPNSFDAKQPCIVTATSSGSRGVYGAISAGEWALKRGCAVAYTDKGTGAAPHDLSNDTVPLIDGTRAASGAAGTSAAFRAALTDSERAAFNAATPNRFAFKHAHSQQNPEKDWGRFTLQAVQFAFYVLNERLGERAADGTRRQTFTRGNTLVIASSISNGGGAALAAAELDDAGWIDAVAVSEPAVELPADPGVSIRRGSAAVPVSAKTLVDFTTYAQVFQSCAALAPSLSAAPFQSSYVTLVGAVATQRCTSLKAKGLLTAADTASQAEEALAKLQSYGWEREAQVLHPSLAGSEVAPAVAVTFANALARAGVQDRLCGYGYAGASALGVPQPLDAATLATLFATGNGVPPQPNSVQLINENAVGGAARDLLSRSPSTNAFDMNLDGALCLRNLVEGNDAWAQRLKAGVDETRRNGNLRGRPAVIVHGRADALLPASHTSRPYTALNKRVEGAASKLSYIEVTNAQHFDFFNQAFPGYDNRYIPLHVYLNRALDAVWANLKNGTALPPSQVVRTVPRGGTPGAAPAITAANVPAIAATPAAADRIDYATGVLTIPD